VGEYGKGKTLSAATSAAPRRKRSIIRIVLLLLGAVIALLGGTYLFLIISSRLPGTYSMGPALNGSMTGMGNTAGMTITHSVTDYALQQCTVPTREFTLEAKEVQKDGQDYYTYNGVVPGPELRVKQGDCLSVTLINHLPVATSIHWHGINVPNAADGVPGVTQNAVKPGESFVYRFIVKDVGTYWYHTHNDTLHQLPKGLFGPLIVEPSGGVGADRDYYVTYHEPHLVNGSAGDVKLAAKSGEKVRLRVLNTRSPLGGPPLPMRLAVVGASFRIVAKDGNYIHGPQQINNQLIAISMAERYDIEFTMPSGNMVRLIDLDSPETISVGDGSVPATPAAAVLQPFDLASYGQATADPLTDRTSFDASYDIHLGDHNGFYDGNYALIHTINDHASPDTVMITVKEGQTVRLRFINDSDENHPMHLHGHHFVLLSLNGKKITGSPIYADTINVTPLSTTEVAFVANNPGLWMAHYHILYHAYSGMMFMINYEGVGTPFLTGSDNQNIPE
jgi:FtsP/CotA-like multicopper oxidase with cupredoxin domain